MYCYKVLFSKILAIIVDGYYNGRLASHTGELIIDQFH